MRPRQKMRRRQRQRSRDKDQRGALAQVSDEIARQQRKGHCTCGSRQHHRPGPAEPGIDLRVENLRQPLGRNPWRPVHGEGVDIGVGHRVMVENPLPNRDLPLRVGVVQQAIATEDQYRIAHDADPQRQ